jgi:hypothetical protein
MGKSLPQAMDEELPGEFGQLKSFGESLFRRHLT